MVIGISRKKIGFNIVVVSEGIRKSKKQKKFSKLLKIEGAVVHRFSVKKLFLEISQNSQKNTCASVSFFIKLLTQVFSCEFCEIRKNTFFTEHLWTTASVSTSGLGYICLTKTLRTIVSSSRL